MRAKLLSYDEMQSFLGRPDWEEQSSNRRELQQAVQVLRTAIAQELTARQRECVELYYFQDRTMEDIGKLLGVGKSTVCRHLQRAKGRLYKAVSYARLAMPLREE